MDGVTDIPDFNEWHSPADWNAVRASGTPGVIFRVGSPQGIDKRYESNRRGAESVGLPWIGYWRPPPGSDPLAEAGKLNAAVGVLPPGCGLSADLENDSASGSSWAGDVLGYAIAFLNEIGPSDYAPPWYANTSFARQFGLAALSPTWPYWVAAYKQLDLSGLPDAALWQYTNTGSFAGVSPCDLNRLRHGTFADLCYRGAGGGQPLSITWKGSPNATAGREGHDLTIAPSYVVIHTMVGSLESANSRFQQAAQQASAHYGVALDGRIWQWVQETDTAYHAGNWDVNLDSIGIEHEDKGDYNGPRTDALYAASAQLVRAICQRWGIPISRGAVGSRSGIVAHRECTATACPDALDVDRIVRQAAAAPQPAPSPTPPPPPAVLAVQGGSMFAFRPNSGERHDAVAVVSGGTKLAHLWGNAIGDDATADPAKVGYQEWDGPPGVKLVAGSAWSSWSPDAKWYVWGAQADDGSWYYGWGDLGNANLSGWKRWAKLSSDVPGGSSGPAGPPGSNTDAALRAYLKGVPG